jgi:hypothetical protein
MMLLLSHASNDYGSVELPLDVVRHHYRVLLAMAPLRRH